MGAETLLIGGLVLGLAGSAAGLGSSLVAADQQRKAAHEAKRDAQRQADELRARGEVEANLRRAQGKRLQSRQRALIGGSGLATDSFFDVLVDSAVSEEYAAQRIANQYRLEAGDVMAAGRSEAKISRRRANALVIGGTTQFVGSVGSFGVQAGSLRAQGYF